MLRFPMLAIGVAGCMAIAAAGFAKIITGELPFGLLLIGFSMSLFGNFRCAASHLRRTAA